ncbi:hypothetical protein [Pelistega ratti]|uniref:hypothetical protein n=1 Tax=Pelistega ratti TaxID=2652177 RepID=UPI00135A3DEC|nr:hypothetical protein [Pelistega ratti]
MQHSKKIMYILGLFLSMNTYALEPEYTAYDKHKAVITCMQHIYLEKYQEIPAEEDAFPLCEQRFLSLSRTLPHKDFLIAKNTLSSLENASSSVNTTDHSIEKTTNIYYDMMLGIPTEIIQTDKSTE